ncbi:Threonine dehydrogenase [Parapedobacter composti]|uniref:Threonine dehydrogenase n=1 Tax=Parapedobacter composti TaxID=623281 RepID=A0A1I1GVS8_9SPHI|nr:zinc-binding alcohol dehydrogenase family protein [Parapedobacter composti]SFC15576.1 Threonine dehydrogenase [Parapedobacter composti]
MNSLVCTKPGQLDYHELAVPRRRAGHTLLKIRQVGICGTDIHAFEGTQPFFDYPRILGHEIAAEVAETDAPGFSVGDAVTVIPYFSCGACVACRRGKPNCCAAIAVCGVHVDGAMAEYFVVPDRALIQGRGLTADQLALVEPFAIGAHGVRRAGVGPGEYVLVVGAGPIGLGTMTFARIAGAEVIALDVNPNRLAFCRSALGVSHTLNALEGDVREALETLTHGDMPTVVIDCTGSLRAINQSFEYLAHGARYVLIGLQKGDITVNHPAFHKREATLMSSRNATRADFDQVLACMDEHLIDPASYITHRIPFEKVGRDFPQLLRPESDVIKAMVTL